MAWPAIADPLSVMFEANTLRMADGAGDPRMGSGFILLSPYQGKPRAGDLRRLPVPLPMAMKTDPLHPLGIVHGRSAVTGHARFILTGEAGQDISVLVAGPALSVPRNGRIEAAGLCLDRLLGVRIVAGNAVPEPLRSLDLLCSVEIPRKILEHIVVTCQALIGFEEIRALLRDLTRVGVKGLLRDLPMTIQT
jgi:hypothetical protein